MINKLLSWLLPLYVFLLPWQARYIIAEYSQGTPFYGDRSLYVTDVLFLAMLIVWILWLRKNRDTVRQQFKRPWMRRLALCLLGLLAFAAISLLWSPVGDVGYEKVYRVMQAYLLAAMIAFGPVSAARLIVAFLASACVQAVWALVQFFQQSIPASTWLGMSQQHPQDLGVSVIEYGDQRWLRAYGTLPHPNMLGGMLTLAAILAAAVYAQTSASMVAWTGKWEMLKKPKLDLFRKIDLGSFVAFILCFIGLLLTFSRSAWLGFAVGMAAIVLLGIVFLRDMRRRAVLFAMIKLGMVSTVLFVFLNAAFGSLWIARTNDQSRLAGVSVSERAQLFEDAKTIIQQHPLRGTGIGGYLPTLMQNEGNRLSDDRPISRYQPVHNTWMLLWAELGVMGLLVFVGWVTALVVNIASLRREPSLILILLTIPSGLAAGAMHYYDHFWFSLPFGLFLAATSIGLILKLQQVEKRS